MPRSTIDPRSPRPLRGDEAALYEAHHDRLQAPDRARHARRAAGGDRGRVRARVDGVRAPPARAHVRDRLAARRRPARGDPPGPARPAAPAPLDTVSEAAYPETPEVPLADGQTRAEALEALEPGRRAARAQAQGLHPPGRGCSPTRRSPRSWAGPSAPWSATCCARGRRCGGTRRRVADERERQRVAPARQPAAPTLRARFFVPGSAEGASFSPAGPRGDMRVICFRDRVVALAGERVVLAPSIAVLEEDHPERRFVAALCLYYGVVCRHRRERALRAAAGRGVCPRPADAGRSVRAGRSMARPRACRAVRCAPDQVARRRDDICGP